MEKNIQYFAIVCIVVLAMLIVYQQTKTKPDVDTADRWHRDENNWKFGVFYFNPDDKRIFPPKRSKLGWTVNFANPVSVMAMVVLLAALLYVLRS